MNYNLSEQEISNYNNYNNTNYTIENNINNNINELNVSGASLEKSQENIIEMEQKNIQMLILQRSIYIMKNRFEKNRKDLELIYDKYKDPNYRQLKCISIINLYNLLKEVMNINQINLLPYDNYNELITADLMTELNEEKNNTMLNALVQFTQKNIEKYNNIFYENKMRKKKLILEKEKGKNKKEEIIVTEEIKIVHFNKRGKIIHDFQKMIENNKKIETDGIIFSINEDDMLILTNKKLLYYDVIPLIIADFLQEYMKNNINIGIVLMNNELSNENDDLNENIKILYDKEIIKLYNNLNKIDPKEEKNEKLKNLLFESNNIENQIRIYNELIVDNSNKGLQVSYLMEMVRKLKEKKIIIQKRITEINKRKYILGNNDNEQYFNTLKVKNNSIDNFYGQSKLNSRNNSKVNLKLNSKKINKKETRENNLLEIFYFYCKQHSFLGLTPTIDQVLKKEKNMNLSEFAKFCIEFKILVKNFKINEIFKKYTKSATYMSFEEFMESLKKMSILVNEEKKQYIKERININELKLKELIEKEEKKKKKRNKKKNKKDNKEEENKEEENKEGEINKNKEEENKNKEDNNKKEEDNNNKEKSEDNKANEENGENKEGKNISDKGNENKESNIHIQSKISEIQIINKEKLLMQNNKEELEKTIVKLKNDYMKLENKSLSELEEELYIYLEIDNPSLYRKKMVGYVQPFLSRGKDTRNPLKNVKNPIKFDKKNIRQMYDLLMQRQEDLKKEKELKKMKEKDILYEKRKKNFNQQIKKLEKNYDDRIKKDNYKQIKKSEEDYLKGKNNKLTWKLIQNCDYDTFLISENKKNKNSIQSNLDDIFTNQSNQLFEKDDEDFINKVYSNDKNKKLKNSYNYSKFSSNQNINSMKNSHLSIESNKKYKLKY